MKRTSAELKRMARENLQGYWGIMIGANVLMYLIIFAAEMPFSFLAALNGYRTNFWFFYLAVIIIGLASAVLQAGILSMYLNIARKQGITLSMMFMQFVKRPDRYILSTLMVLGICILCMGPGYVCLIVGVEFEQYLALWISLPLIIAGGIIYMILLMRFALALIFLVDYPQMKVLEAYRESASVMNGNKGRLFYIMLSFIGMILLAMLSCGIGMLWVMPYAMQTMVQFYLDVTGGLDVKEMQKPAENKII